MRTAVKIFGAVLLIIFLAAMTPEMLTSLATVTADVNIADYTLLEMVVNWAPALLWIGALGAVFFMVFNEVKMRRSGGASTSGGKSKKLR
ncbi:hypothetical protein ABFB09_09165 [Dehalogenimonas sp. THU2]|uniref:hypothetical protein n=1 Tax=Dehalogenimonas sp. THU2 TaxID=3151121 RepID=UPI003218C493